MIASLSRINDGSGISLIVICPNSNIICSINQKQYETWSEHNWINARGKEVKHGDKWQRVRELIHKKLSDITARAPSQEDEAIMHKLGAEKIQRPYVNFIA